MYLRFIYPSPFHKPSFIEILFVLERFTYRKIYSRTAFQMVVIQICIRCIKSVYTSGCLLHYLITVVLRIEYNSVGLNTVPTLGSRIVLHEIYPFFRFLYLLMLIHVPLRNVNLVSVIKRFKYLKLVVKVIKYNGSGMFLQQLQQYSLTCFIAVHDLAPDITKFCCVLYGFIFKRIPSVA